MNVDTYLTCILRCNAEQAKVVARGGGQKGFMKKGREAGEARLKRIPLLMAECRKVIETGYPFEKKKVTQGDNLYFNGFNGRLLQLRGKMLFSDAADGRIENVQDLDRYAQFTEIPKSDVPPFEDVLLRFTEKEISLKVKSLFGIEPSGFRTVLLPVWEVDYKDLDKGSSGKVYIDGAIGLEIEGDPTAIEV